MRYTCNIMGLSLGRQKKKLTLVADIESGSVRVALVEMQTGVPARVLVVERTRLAAEQKAKEQNAAGVLAALNEIMQKVAKIAAEPAFVKEHGVVQDMHAVVGGPWLSTRTVHAEEHYSSEKTLRDQDIQAIAKKALQEPSSLKGVPLETNVIRVQLNGYATGKPIGKKAAHIAVTVFQSCFDEAFKAHIQQTLQAVFPGRTLTFCSRVRALMTTLHERSMDVHHYFVVSIEDSVTTCIAVRKEEVTEQAVIPEGVATFSTRFGGSAPPEETASLVSLIGKDTCSTPACETVRANIARAESELTSIFGKTFGALTENRRLPNHCVLVIDERYADWCETFLSRIDFSQFTITAQPFIVESLTPAHLRSYVLFPNGTEDTGVGISASFVHIQDSV